MNPETKKLWDAILKADKNERRAIAQRAFKDAACYLFPLFAKWEKTYAFILKVIGIRDLRCHDRWKSVLL